MYHSVTTKLDPHHHI